MELVSQLPPDAGHDVPGVVPPPVGAPRVVAGDDVVDVLFSAGNLQCHTNGRTIKIPYIPLINSRIKKNLKRSMQLSQVLFCLAC